MEFWLKPINKWIFQSRKWSRWGCAAMNTSALDYVLTTKANSIVNPCATTSKCRPKKFVLLFNTKLNKLKNLLMDTGASLEDAIKEKIYLSMILLKMWMKFKSSSEIKKILFLRRWNILKTMPPSLFKAPLNNKYREFCSLSVPFLYLLWVLLLWFLSLIP